MTAIAIIDRGLVALAVLVALPTVLGDLYAVLALPKGKSGSTHVLARLFRFGGGNDAGAERRVEPEPALYAA